jgi:two-component system alkaline phosphatase synthesis response regulator PhoP
MEGMDTASEKSEKSEKTVLIVEDEPDVQLFLQTILEDAGFKVLTASDGEIALKMIKERKPDLISLDLVLPKVSGHKVLRTLKKDEELSGIPVLIVTAHADDDLGKGEATPVLDSIWRPKSLNQGPGMFLRKPVKPLDYVRSVERALGIESSEEAELRLKAKEELERLMRQASPEELKTMLDVLRKGN